MFNFGKIAAQHHSDIAYNNVLFGNYFENS